MKKTVKKDQETPRRLALHRETIQNLQPELLEIVHGGITTSGTITLDHS